MTTLAADTSRDFELGDLNDLPVVANDIIYEGAAVGDNGSGFARPLQAGDPFRGFARVNVDNSDGSAGDKNVSVREGGRVVLDISGLAITDVGKAVYASDDDTFTLTRGSNSYVGRVIRWIATGSGVVKFDASKGSLGLEAELTDSTTGTADDTLADVGGTFSQSTLNNNFADLAAKVNHLLRMVR